ncbi:MAG: hypothetical protein HY525_12185 [Betaproteobacteria bacterium]|nr:hypothetical protein [Betaproteobacteria bacterium]
MKNHVKSIVAAVCCAATGLVMAAPPLSLTTNNLLTASVARNQPLVSTGTGGPANPGAPHTVIPTPVITPSVQSEIDAFVAAVLQAGNAQLLADRFGSATINVAGKVCDQRTATSDGGVAGGDTAQCGLTVLPDGSMVVAPGKSIEISDRGTDGLRFLIAAPEDAPLDVTRLLAEAARNGMLGALKPARSVASNVVVENDGRVLLKNRPAQ